MTKEQITIDDVRKLDLRVGKILHAERVPGSLKLIKLTVDLGFEQRTIVTGSLLHDGEERGDISYLAGEEVLVVANLKPAVFMGIESRGMVLTSEGFDLPQFKYAKPGATVS